MPIIIVHGAGVRKESSGYEHARLLSEKLFCEHFQNVFADPTPTFVYWGDLGAKFAWRVQFVRAEEAANFSRYSTLDSAVTALSHALLQGRIICDPDEAAEFIVAAQSYADRNPSGSWMRKKMGDAEFVESLAKRIGCGRVSFHDTRSELGKLVAWLRPTLDEHVGLFLGDAFSYLGGRRREQIFARISDAISEGPRNEPLILVGHSLGGVILFDYLSANETAAHLFVSVGSQISYFENLKLLLSSDASIPNANCPRAGKPRGVVRWLNIRDSEDILAFGCGDIFEGVEEMEYDTKTNPIMAHLSYLTQQRFVRLLSREARLEGPSGPRDRP